MRRILVTALLLALAGCSSRGMDEAECHTADWRAIGYEDGAQGYSTKSFGNRRKACAEHGVVAKFDDYMAGHDQGLTRFCRPQNGYNLGAQGYRYSGVCPAEFEAGFLAAHGDGFGLYTRRREVNRIARNLDRARARSAEIEHQIAESTTLLISPGIPPARRAELVIELKQLAEEKIRVEESIPELEYDYEVAKRALDDYRAEIATRPAD